MADERLRTIGSAFLAKVARRLADIDPNELGPADLARWTDVALKLEEAGSRREPYDRAARLAAAREAADGIDPDRADMVGAGEPEPLG